MAIPIPGNARRSLWIATLLLTIGNGLVTSGEVTPKFTGRFDRHVVEMTWYGLCANRSNTTNTYAGHVETLQLPDAMGVCSMDLTHALNAMLTLSFPDATPPGSTSVLRTLKFDTPLRFNVALNGNLTIADISENPTNVTYNTQTLTVEIGPYDYSSSAACPEDEMIHGPGLAEGVYSLDVASSCQRNSLTFPERSGDDLIYENAFWVHLQIYEPAYPPGSRILLGGDIIIRSYYRLDTTKPDTPGGLTLSLAMTDGRFVLSWPAAASGFVLESTDQFGPTCQWEAEPNVERVGDQNVFRVTPSGQGRYYRLRQE